MVPIDALKIINEIARHGTRTFSVTETVSSYFDTSNDGAITPLDALRVINEIARQRRGGAAEGETGAANDAVLAAWTPDTQRRVVSPVYDEFLYGSGNQTRFERSNDARCRGNRRRIFVAEDFRVFFVDKVDRPGNIGWLIK